MANRIEHDPALAHGEDSISDLQERVLSLLEDAGIPTKTNDAILALIEAAEWEQHRDDLQRQEDAEAKYWSDRSPENPPPFD
jgi:hypothetical protein